MADYVIIGAGSAGCVLAARLSEDPENRVTLLEAGPPDTASDIAVPAAFPKLFKTEHDWDYQTVPQAGAAGRSFQLPRGKVLGGCSSINAMLYLRGHPADYDGWAEATGDTGWSWEQVLPLFRRSERQGRELGPLHGYDGPLHVSDQRSVLPISRAFVDAAAACGHPRNDDFNGLRQEGFGLYQVTQRRGSRCSAANAFLAPSRSRSNLEVITGAVARRIVFEGNRAVGVRVSTPKGDRVIHARKEVIVSAGAFNSPQLLMLSGVGDPDLLREHGIETVVASPEVGRNLQDHVYATLHYRTRGRTLDTAEDVPFVVLNLLKYLVARRGPFTSCVAESGGFLKTDPDLPAPDLQFHFAPVYFVDHGQTEAAGRFASLAPTLLTPRSRGTVTLASADPTAPPVIDPAWLSAPEDLERLITGFRLGRAILEAEPMAPYGLEMHHPPARLDTDDDIARHIRERMDHIYHPVGTCRMGSDDDAVVDAQLRVRGAEGLRVVDASIMPTITRGNTNAPTILIAERAADLIVG